MLYEAITVLVGIYIDAVVLQLKYFPKSTLLSKSKIQNVPFPNIKKIPENSPNFYKILDLSFQKKGGGLVPNKTFATNCPSLLN